jgi:Lipopolysaccharide-assembly
MQHPFRFDRLALIAIALLTLATPACMRDGRVDFLGYTIGSLHDTRYRTIYVPIFENKAFQSGPLRGLEYRLTEAVQKEIERSTPYKVVSNRDRADTELLGAIVATPKHILNRNQLNEIREGQMDIKVELVWRDLHTNEILSKPSPTEGMNTEPEPERPAPSGPLVKPGLPPPSCGKTVVLASGHFVPELGESQTTALAKGCKRLAVQIVSLMEKPW